MTAIGYLSESFEMLTFWEVGWVFVHSSVAMAPSLSPLAGLLHFFFFLFLFLFCMSPAKFWEGFSDRGSCVHSLKTCSPGCSSLCFLTQALQAAAAVWDFGAPTCSSASSLSCPRSLQSHPPPRPRRLQMPRKVSRRQLPIPVP